MDQQKLDGASASSREERILRRAASVYVPTATHARVLIAVVAQVRSSYLDRDLSTADYRDYAIAAVDFLHARPTRHTATLPSRFGIAPRARPSGMVVAAPVRMGRRCLADAIESAIGRGPVMTRVRTSTGFAQYLQLRSLRVQWPVEGKISGFAHAFVGAFDAAFNTNYASHIRNPVFRESRVTSAIAALGVASNLGLLIVEGIGVDRSMARASDSTWQALAQFTRATGIPVLCLATPGAAVLGLSKLSSATGTLAPNGVIEITRSRKASEKHWIDICKAQFDATLREAGVAEMPPWFPAVAYDLTLGYPGLLASALTNLALQLLSLGVRKFNAEMFQTYGANALALHEGEISAVRQIDRGGRYTKPSLIRHGDWLSLSQLSSTHLAPELIA